MSGGVDSSMALILLKKQGWSPVGVSLKYAIWQDKANLLNENICCSAESLKIAENVCKKFGVPHYIFDVAEHFKKEVINYFVAELKNNRTPNPCIICNRQLKFKKLFDWAQKQGIEYVATGHYAQISENLKAEKHELLVAKDNIKDQTYSLSFLPQKWLGRLIFPLGSYTKEQVFQIAKEQGFGFYLKRKESQDFCFVSGKCIDCFLEKEIGRKEGQIKDVDGNVLGKHRGLHFYTIGQRKGINLSHGPYYVVGKHCADNILVVSKDQQDLLSKKALLSPFNFISGEPLKKEIRIKAKIRSQHSPASATLFPLKKDCLKLVFDRPQKSITPGQFAVFYKDDVCLGGGRVIS